MLTSVCHQPAVVTRQFPGYHWIYWVAPILGALLATAFYKLVKALEFDLVNPDIDAPPTRSTNGVTGGTGGGKLGTEGAGSNGLHQNHSDAV